MKANKKIVLIFLSVIFIIFNIILVLDRVVIPNVKNAKYKKELQKEQERVKIEQEKEFIGDPEVDESEQNLIKEKPDNPVENVPTKEEITKQNLDEEVKRKILESQGNKPIEVDLPQNDTERVKFAIGSYFAYINSKNYKLAYDMLTDTFKQINFSTYEMFETYCKEKYSGYYVLNYDYYQRMGDILLSEVIIEDIYKNNKTYKTVFTILEINENKYELSFGLNNNEDVNPEGGEND